MTMSVYLSRTKSTNSLRGYSMNRIILLILFSLSVFCTWSQSTNISKIESQLICADSLFAAQEYNNVIKLLLPLEDTLVIVEDQNIKRAYYSMLSMSYYNNKDFVTSVQYMEKGAVYNQYDLDDLVFAANVSVKELYDYNRANHYARRALIKYYGSPFFEKNVNLNYIGRLLYLLGLSYVNSRSLFMAKECINIHSSLNLEEQCELNQDLTERIEFMDPSDPSISQITREFIQVNSWSLSKHFTNFNKQDSIQKINAIKSCHPLKLENLDYYLKNVISLDSIYETNQDLYSSKRLLDTAVQNINDSKIQLSSCQGIQLMVRLGRIYSIFKDNDEALEWLFMAKNRCDESGTYDDTYISILQQIAMIYIEKDIFWSRLLIEEAIEIFEGVYGNIYEQFKISKAYNLLNNYAYILQKCSDYDVAENIYRHILKTCPDSNGIVFALNNYGVLLSELERNTEAIYYYEQLNNLFPDIFCMTNLIVAYIENGDYHKSESIFKQYVTSMIGTTINSWATLTNSEIENWWNQSAQKFYMSSNCFADKINSPRSLKYGFDATIFCKTFPLLYKSVLRKCIEKSDNMITSNLREAIKHSKDELIKTKENDLDTPYLLHIKIQQLEDSLKANIPELSHRIMDMGITFKDVANVLDDNEAAIEFFEYVDLLSDSISIQYAAYVVLPDSDAPIMVKLASFQNMTDMIRNVLLDETELNSTYSKTNDIIYKWVWDKLMPYISNKETIYYSTSGAISFINHNIIHDTSGLMLYDKFNLYRVSSTSQIPIVKENINMDFGTAVLYGNIDYDTTPQLMTNCSNKYDYTHAKPNHIVIPSETTRSGWTNLKNSTYEINMINAILDSVGINTKIFEKNHANEESLKKSHGKSSDIIHFATHGFSAYKHKTYQDKSHISYTNYDQTMSFEALLLSGANNIWLGKQLPPDIEDGLLTAEEISNLDLSDTKLVVLSACETGKGSINMLGQIIGLQDAFKMAGAKSILMSLWQVPDESTALLMTKFYEALFNGHNRHEALKIAMKNVREIYPDPYYWGAFVILD